MIPYISFPHRIQADRGQRERRGYPRSGPAHWRIRASVRLLYPPLDSVGPVAGWKVIGRAGCKSGETATIRCIEVPGSDLDGDGFEIVSGNSD